MPMPTKPANYLLLASLALTATACGHPNGGGASPAAGSASQASAAAAQSTPAQCPVVKASRKPKGTPDPGAVAGAADIAEGDGSIAAQSGSRSVTLQNGGETSILENRSAGGQPGNVSCQANALEQLKALDPHGYSLYLAQKSFYTNSAWWSCDDFVSDLDTASHETTHVVDGGKNAYTLADGTTTPFVPVTKVFFPPSEIASQLDPSLHHAFYIIAQHDGNPPPSSVSQVRYLLDELNAYSVGLNTTNKLMKLKRGEDDSRDGALAIMYYFELYADRAKANHPETWAALNAGPVRSSIRKLWQQAEAVETTACQLNVPGIQDGYYLKRRCAPTGHDAISELLGAKPLCLQQCLDQANQRGDDGG